VINTFAYENFNSNLSSIGVCISFCLLHKNGFCTYIIQDVSIDANFLFVTVQYQASCSGKDKIELIGSEQLVSATVPIRQVKLVIQANDEDCHELQSRTLTFRIHALSGMKVRDFTTDLQISGYRTKMRYVYV
jgi:hypothetical protein